MPSYLSPGVYVEEVPSGSSSLSAGATAIAAFVGYTEKGPKSDDDPNGASPRLVTSWTQYESLYGGFIDGAMLPHAVYGWFNNGGSSCYIARIPHVSPSTKPRQLALPAADKSVGKDGKVVEITSKEPVDGLTVTVTVNNEVDPDAPDAGPTFDLIVFQDGKEVEALTDLSVDPKSPNAVATKTKDAKFVTVAVADLPKDLDDLSLAMPKPGNYPVKAADPGTPIQNKAPHFVGSETARRGINGLSAAEDATIVMVPDLITAARTGPGRDDWDKGMWKAVHAALISHCEQHGNRMAILDPPPGRTVQEMKAWRAEGIYSSAFATMYYPWVKISNPIQTADAEPELTIPPSGHIAGLWARTDNTRGVWKAPANDTLRGVVGLERDITMAEQGHLNPDGVNCIRPFGTRGIRVWGARTLAADTDWRYINVRRLFNMIETTIMEGTQWAVFEPNDMKLWEGVKRTLNAFLRGLWRDGALFGATAEQAFFVKCDAETNPPDSIDEGKLVVEVGIAPVKPAEFVIFRISQFKDAAA
jgi:phage tail sheath protein FI